MKLDEFTNDYQLADRIRKECSDSIKFEFYRGESASNREEFDDIILIQPEYSVRRSRWTRNYYTLLLDNLPNWQSYPKRSKSVVFTTEWKNAAARGTIYRIFPKNGYRIAVCPSDDIWSSFHKSMSCDLGKFNYVLSVIPDSIFENMIKFLFIHKDTIIERMLNHIYPILPSMNTFLSDLIKADNANDIIVAFEKLFNPVFNGFQLFKTNNYHYIQDTEHWTDAPCYMVKDNTEICEYILTGIKL